MHNLHIASRHGTVSAGWARKFPQMSDNPIHFLPRSSHSTPVGKVTAQESAAPTVREPAPLPELYRDVCKSSGMSRSELRERMAWSNNAAKTLRLLDSLLEGKCPDPAFEKRFIEVMEIPMETLIRTRQRQAVWEVDRNEEQLAAQVGREFRSYGSHLVVLPNRNYKPNTMFGRWGMKIGCRIPLDMARYPANQPPAPEDMGRCIASMQPALKAMLPLSIPMIGGFVYYRLPGEIYSYDVNGGLVGFGDTFAILPEDSWML